MIFLISYDLNVPGRDYEKLYEVLKSAEGWWHYLDSTWVLSTKESLSSWQKKIHDAIDDNDSYLIVDITGQSLSGWLPKKAWEWLKNHDNR